MNPQQALAGKKVYGQGSFAPTKGRVSANGMQGYLQRSQRLGGVRKVGGDGQSDTRSGLAQMAMQRREMAGGKRPNQSFQAPNNQRLKPPTKPGGGPSLVGGGAASATAAQSSGSNVPQVTVNNNGQLELPYNPAWSQELLQQMGQYNSDLAALQGEQQQEGLAYGQATRQAGEDYTGQKRTTLNTNAGAGTAFSSAYGVQASNDAGNYQNTINEMLAQHDASNTAFDTERTAIINAFKQQMQQSALAYAEQTAQKAGTLGYGQAKTSRQPGQNASAYANSARKKLKSKGKQNLGGRTVKPPKPKGKK